MQRSYFCLVITVIFTIIVINLIREMVVVSLFLASLSIVLLRWNNWTKTKSRTHNHFFFLSFAIVVVVFFFFFFWLITIYFDYTVHTWATLKIPSRSGESWAKWRWNDMNCYENQPIRSNNTKWCIRSWTINWNCTYFQLDVCVCENVSSWLSNEKKSAHELSLAYGVAYTYILPMYGHIHINGLHCNGMCVRRAILLQHIVYFTLPVVFVIWFSYFSST